MSIFPFFSGKEIFAFFKSIAEQLKDETDFVSTESSVNRMGGGGGVGQNAYQEDVEQGEEVGEDFGNYGNYGQDYGDYGWDYYYSNRKR